MQDKNENIVLNFDNIFLCTNDPKLLWLQYRINHRLLGTKYWLKKMNIVLEDSCTFCNRSPETIEHIFCSCDITKQFSVNLSRYINNTCNLNQNEWNTRDILFGKKALDTVTNIHLIQAKQYVYKYKMKEKTPLLAGFKQQIKSLYQTEKYMVECII